MYLGNQKSGSLLNIYYSNCHAEWGQSSCVSLSLLHELMQPVITTQHCKYLQEVIWETKHSMAQNFWVKMKILNPESHDLV